MTLHRSSASIDFRIRELPALPPARRALMADPRDYEVAYAINPHMRDAEGRLCVVDREAALAEWQALKASFESAGIEVEVLPALAGHPDLVFCANPVLPLPPGVAGESSRIVPSRMASAERRSEPFHLARFLAARGHSVEELTGGARAFEGTGDGLWHPGRRLLWAGVGPRSDAAAWEEIARRYELEVIVLELRDPDFYHLDTCLALLREDTCLWYPGAFDERGRDLVQSLVPDAIEAEEEEARRLLACNAWCPDGRHVWIQRGAARAAAALRGRDFDVREVATDEFLKAGGSVFCLKLALP